jgi:hypothetical protein
MTWREFAAYVLGLFAVDSRLYRHFTPQSYDPTEGVNDGG